MKKKVELLAPAGTMEALKAAVQNGCDAVYLGGSMFGARAFAGNFNHEEMAEAIAYAHIYGVKVYVTMNTLLYENEIDEAVNYAYFLYTHDVDAVIIQDLGLMDRLRIQIPDLELHASTQMHIHNKDGIELIKQSGVKRVVLPRETSIEEIHEFAKLGIDLEVFVHGALCVCYSGQCLMSSVLFERSGNRGACAQPCRMKYQLVREQNGRDEVISTLGNYLLSTKDLNTIEYIGDLIKAGVTSFKIEGRMKRPEYVAQVVSLYREAIDFHMQNKEFLYSKKKEQDLLKVFNRGFTKGYIFHQPGDNYMNPIRPNHMGIPLGKIIRTHNHKAEIRLEETLTQGDGIRILDDYQDQGWMVNKIYKNGLLVHQASIGEIVEIEYRGFIKKGSSVLKTSDSEQLAALQSSLHIPHRKIMIDIDITLKINQPIFLKIEDEERIQLEEFSEFIVQKAKKAPLDEERIVRQMKKCNDYPFAVRDIKVHMEENCFFAISSLNQFRRDVLDKLMLVRKKRHTYQELLPYHKKLPDLASSVKNYVMIEKMEQYQICEEYGIKNIITKNHDLYHKLKKNGKQIFFHEGRVGKGTLDCFMSGDVGGILRNCTYFDYSLNITNSYAAAFLFAKGATFLVLSQECHYEDIVALQKNFKKMFSQSGNFGIYAYGRQELMIMKTCIIQNCLKTDHRCGLCTNHSFFLKDMNGRRFPLIKDNDCHMRILSDSFITNTSYNTISKMLNFTTESGMLVKEVLHDFNMIHSNVKESI